MTLMMPVVYDALMLIDDGFGNGGQEGRRGEKGFDEEMIVLL